MKITDVFKLLLFAVAIAIFIAACISMLEYSGGFFRHPVRGNVLNTYSEAVPQAANNNVRQNIIVALNASGSVLRLHCEDSRCLSFRPGQTITMQCTNDHFCNL